MKYNIELANQRILRELPTSSKLFSRRPQVGSDVFLRGNWIGKIVSHTGSIWIVSDGSISFSANLSQCTFHKTIS